MQENTSSLTCINTQLQHIQMYKGKNETKLSHIITAYYAQIYLLKLHLIFSFKENLNIIWIFLPKLNTIFLIMVKYGLYKITFTCITLLSSLFYPHSIFHPVSMFFLPIFCPDSSTLSSPSLLKPFKLLYSLLKVSLPHYPYLLYSF